MQDEGVEFTHTYTHTCSTENTRAITLTDRNNKPTNDRANRTPVTRLTQLIRIYFQVYFCLICAPLHSRGCHTNKGLTSKPARMIYLGLRRPHRYAKKTTGADVSFSYQPCLEATDRALHETISQHVCTPGPWRDIRRHTHAHTHNGWCVLGGVLQAEPSLHEHLIKKKKKN